MSETSWDERRHLSGNSGRSKHTPEPAADPGAQAFARFRALFDRPAVWLAPMEDVSDAPFRRLCRTVGADVCVTEFVNVESLLAGVRRELRRLELGTGDSPTGIQIYGGDPALLVEAAKIAEAASPAFIDINCGCWIPRIARRGAGAGWLKSPEAMVSMARRVVSSVKLPVTVKTRIGVGTEAQMPIVDLARRLEDAGVEAITLHCRTAMMRHDGAADWSWAARAQAAVRIPVLVNGDLKTAQDVVRALRETGCRGAMVGRGAIAHPWIFRETRALLEGAAPVTPPSPEERLRFTRQQLLANAAERGEKNAVECLRRHLRGYLSGVLGEEALRLAMYQEGRLGPTLGLLDKALETLQQSDWATGRPAEAQLMEAGSRR